ncbi:MAG TPA: DNA repair protein RecO [Spirochaetota bacterium]|nr:DNA repair protein RecO [Spirochaetota bacterium]
MPLLRTDGIVLTRRLSGESDFICSIYTRDHGKKQFIFKGLKKTRKRPVSLSEPGSVICITYYSKENSTINAVSSFEPVFLAPAIRKEALKIHSLYYIVELVEKTSGEADSASDLYNLISSGIGALEKTGMVMHFNLFFTVRYMAMQGILPGTGRCIHCGSENALSYDVDSHTLNFTCSACSEYEGADISGRTALFMRRSSSERFSLIDMSDVPENEVSLLFIKTAGFIENYYGFRFKSLDMLMFSRSSSDKEKGRNP